MNYAIEQRMRFIDFILEHYGFIHRSVLMDYFGMGEAAATRDFKKYLELAPDNMVYSTKRKAYYKTEVFVRHYE